MANLRLVVSNAPYSPGGEELRNIGIDQVLSAASPDWKSAVATLIYNLPENWQGIFEDIRLMAEAAGLWAHAPEAWGGIAQTALNNGTLRYKTPLQERPMTDPRSHARTSKVMVRTGKI